jgi:hypothetical protein
LVSQLKEEKSLRAFKYKMLRKIFGPKQKEITGDCIRKKRNVYRILIGKQTGK